MIPGAVLALMLSESKPVMLAVVISARQQITVFLVAVVNARKQITVDPEQ